MIPPDKHCKTCQGAIPRNYRHYCEPCRLLALAASHARAQAVRNKARHANPITCMRCPALVARTRSYCDACRKIRSREYAAAHKAKHPGLVKQRAHDNYMLHREARLAKQKLGYVYTGKRPRLYDHDKLRPQVEFMIRNGGDSGDLVKLIGCPYAAVSFHVNQMFGCRMGELRRRLRGVPLTEAEEWELKLKAEHLTMDRGLNSHLSYGENYNVDSKLRNKQKQGRGPTDWSEARSLPNSRY